FYMGDLNTIVIGTNSIPEFSLQWKHPASPGYWIFKAPGNNAWDHIPPLAGPTGRFPGLLNYAMNDTAVDNGENIAATLSVIAALIDQYDNPSAIDSGSTTTI